MKNIFNIFILVILTACSTTSGVKNIFSSHEFRLRPFRDVTLKNGLKVTLIEDKSLPYFSMSMLIRVGSVQDPQGLSGLSDMVGDLLDKGTRAHTAVELSDNLSQYGGEMGISTGKDATFATASSLSFYQDKLIHHFAEVISEPAFSQVEMERLRKRKLAQIKELADDPDAVTELAFEAFLYPQHPYGNSVAGTGKDLRKMTKKNVTLHYLNYYRPSNSHLAVVGQFSDDIVEKLEAGFGKWTDRAITPRAATQFPEAKDMQLMLVDRQDLKQAQIRFGHQGIRRNNPDFITLRVASALLGGGFSSRLMTEIRVKRGLTYNISSFFDARWDEGPFVITTFTRPEKIGETVREVLRVVKEFKEQGPSEIELSEAKELLKGSFPRSLETPEALASNLLYLRFYGVPDSYLSNYLKNVDRVTVADVKSVLNKYFKPDEFKILVHAPRGTALPQLKEMGTVKIESPSKFL